MPVCPGIFYFIKKLFKNNIFKKKLFLKLRARVISHDVAGLPLLTRVLTSDMMCCRGNDMKAYNGTVHGAHCLSLFFILMVASVY